MNRRTIRGFTLLELLTVIAIIAILAGITFAVFPRIRERARVRSLQATMNELRTALAQYYATHGTYPPAYGYLDFQAVANYERTSVRPADNVLFNLKPFMTFIRLHGADDHYDNFSEGYDADRDGAISLFEFSPVGAKDQATGRYSFPDTVRYNGNNASQLSEFQRMGEEDQRPLIYIPVNKRQFDRARKYWIRKAAEDPAGLDFYALSWDPTDPMLQGVVFPPSSYDTFVLISVGPGGTTFGIPPPAPINNDQWDQATLHVMNNYPDDMYHIIGMRAYFVATRDLDDNGKLDFHFEDRRTGEARGTDTYQIIVDGSTVTVPLGNLLPDRRAPNGYGPYIYKY
ncbi:MAG TPA: type II secretion system protein [Candidatus Hydrogenedentes bacterium]|nr:type II secretion system protein [Candidatus Hydrogenedentota bacterium]HNT86758.1 type II secretion system protein [Candidatus Hydrogenedentota bacterium]